MAYAHAVREVLGTIYVKVERAEDLLHRDGIVSTSSVPRPVFVGNQIVQYRPPQPVGQIPVLFHQLKTTIKGVIRDTASTSVLDRLPVVRELKQTYDYVFGNLNADRVDSIPSRVHDSRLKLEQLVALVHAKAGGSAADDVLSCATADLKYVDPWPYVHPTGIGTF
ncbi:unnamed protein product [Amoebophrya sp. A120]|nr:unnamed protein product [Amoebophrya sp. A120]|eukprot:GSA120T00025686001.1